MKRGTCVHERHVVYYMGSCTCGVSVCECEIDRRRCDKRKADCGDFERALGDGGEEVTKVMRRAK